MKPKKKKPPIKMTPECTTPGCWQQAVMLPDTSKPPVHHHEPSTKTYTNSDGTMETSNLTSIISHPEVVHPSGLCYFHLKQSQGLFNCKYPLKSIPSMFD